MKKHFWLLGFLTLSFLSNAQNFTEQSLKFNKALSFIDMFYVDTINQKQLVEEAIVSMLKDLDPHSVYISPEEVREMNEPLQGNFEGVGIQFSIQEDTIIVVSPISGGPSEKLGIRPGDRIVKINDKVMAGIGVKNKDVFDKLRGAKGTKVKMSIFRKGEKELIEYEVTRDKIPIFSIDAAYMIDNEIGYIKLSRFSATSMDEFTKALNTLKTKNVKSLILDLRNNGGGYLNIAIDLADQFLNDNKMIVFTEGRNSPRADYKSTKKGDFENGKLVVLVDEGSASASEIVSGAIQDWDRGIILGRRSFGKGLVQRPFTFPDNSMIRLTIARYYTPTGRSIQKPYEDAKEYSKDLINRYNKGELSNKDSIHFPESLKYKTLLNQRTVYGGGGIMPDLFIPLDTTKFTDYYRNLLRKGTINKFTFNYIDKNRASLTSQYTDFKVYNKTFEVSDKMIEELNILAEKDKVTVKPEELEKSKGDIKLQIKALIARDLWDTSEYFEVINPSYDDFNKAVELIKDDKAYKKLISKK